MDMEKKEKIKKVIKNVWLGISTFLSMCFIVVCAVACSSVSKQQTNNNTTGNVNEVVIQENKKYVSVDEETQDITFTYEEFFDNWVFSNYFDYVNTYYDAHEDTMPNETCTINLVGDIFSPMDKVNVNDYRWTNDNDSAMWIQLMSNYTWTNNINTDVVPVENVTLTFATDEAYEAVLLDIQANSRDIIGNGGIFENLTSSVVGFVGSLSSGIVAITSIFYSNNALTPIGIMSVLVVAITLSYFLLRLLFGLIRMRG